MHTHVYANGLEIASKAVGGDGSSAAAFPDPCWSPPPPTGGPVVIPYPNTCYASAIENGTVTVFIAGQMSAIEDHSRFGTSTGNEPATQAFSKGVKTGVITGKAYFTQWSNNVFFEGLGVPRHTDLVTHNHGSMPSNTPTFPYLSRQSRYKCNKEDERIERACKPETDESDSRKELRSKSPLLNALKGKRKASPKKTNDKPHWTDDHCDGLQVNLASHEVGKAYAQEMKEIYDKLPGELDVMQSLKSELQDMVADAGKKAAGKWLLKAGIKQAAGTSVPLAGNVAMGIWSAVDAAMAIGDVKEIRKIAIESLEKLDVLEKQGKRLQGLADEFKDFDKLSPKEQEEKVLKLGAEGQDVLATLNDCTRARKCSLVPKSKKDGSRNVETADGMGCCGGQTGHHLIYGKMMEDAGCSKEYEYETAPTVCVEGFSQNHGSHGRVHDKMDEQVTGLANGKKLTNGTMSMDQAIDSAVKSHQEAFPASRCRESCIRAQLEEYYKDKCPNARPSAVNKAGKPIVPDTGGGGSR